MTAVVVLGATVESPHVRANRGLDCGDSSNPSDSEALACPPDWGIYGGTLIGKLSTTRIERILMVKAGWNKTELAPYDYRWWDGNQWSDAYWPHSRPKKPYLPDAPRWDISAPGEPRLDLVGENWHEAAIAQAIGGLPRLNQDVETYLLGELIPERDNPHDPNAVSVRVGGRVIAYLSTLDAERFAPVLQRIVEANTVPVVNTRIWAVTRYSHNRGREELKSAIRVALTTAEAILPANPAPREPHAVIPYGRSVQVTGEDKHFDILGDYVGADGPLLVTLHLIQTSRDKTALEVRLDGERVGQLTPATSASLQPLYDEATAQGLVTTAWATLKGSHLAAELRLHALRAEEVPESWPASKDCMPQLARVQPVPPAYESDEPLPAPPAPSGLGAWWILIGFFALMLAAVPAIGPVLTILVLGAAFIWRAVLVRRAPKSARPGPSTTA